jgi:hypothetical protein
MRELGHRGGKARRKGVADQLPTSLREELRKLDPAVVRGAIEQALAGNNESARVSAVKLLADVDAFSREGGCPVCAEREAEGPAEALKLLALLEKYIEFIAREEFFAEEYVDSKGVVRAAAEEHDSEMTAMIRRALRRAREGHDDLVEELAQARLQALREEHGLVGV